MKIRSRLVNTVAAVAAAGLALTAAGAASAQVGPIEANAPPPVALSTHALEAASAYRAYVKRAESISPNFTSGAGVEASVAVGASWEPQQLAHGAIAYAALIALQDPTFVAGVRTYALDPGQRHDIAQRLVQDPYYATAFPGAANAAGLIESTLGIDGAQVHSVGAAVKQAAYSVQHFPWSTGKIINSAARLTQAKAISAAPMMSTPEDVAVLRAAVNGAQDPSVRLPLPQAAPATGSYSPVVQRGLALAALAVLGEAGDDNDASVQSLLNDQSEGFCLNMSKLNLYQCLAVAGPWYEDIFCLGEHGLMETAQCLEKEAGPPAVTQVAMATTVPAAVASTAVDTPEAKTSTSRHHYAVRHRRYHHRRAD